MIDLDAIGGHGPPEHRDRRRLAALAEREPRRDGDRPDRRADRGRAAARRLLRPADRPRLPVHALRAGPVRRRRNPGGHDHDGRRPPARRPSATRVAAPRLGAARPARARPPSSCSARSTRASSSAPSSSSYVWVGGRVVRGWAIELVLIALLVPFARRDRRPLRPLPPAPDLAAGRRAERCAAGFSSGFSSVLVFTCFRLLGRLAVGARRGPPNPATAIAGDWPAIALIALARDRRARLAARPPAPDRAAPDHRRGGGRRLHRRAARACSSSRCSSIATNAFALLFVLPALHVWLWLPQIRIARPPVRALLFVARPRRARAPRRLVRLALRPRVRRALVPARARRRRLRRSSPASRSRSPATAAACPARRRCGRPLRARIPTPSERGPRGPFRELVALGRGRRPLAARASSRRRYRPR